MAIQAEEVYHREPFQSSFVLLLYKFRQTSAQCSYLDDESLNDKNTANKHLATFFGQFLPLHLSVHLHDSDVLTLNAILYGQNRVWFLLQELSEILVFRLLCRKPTNGNSAFSIRAHVICDTPPSLSEVNSWVLCLLYQSPSCFFCDTPPSLSETNLWKLCLLYQSPFSLKYVPYVCTAFVTALIAQYVYHVELRYHDSVKKKTTAYHCNSTSFQNSDLGLASNFK